MLMVPSVVTSQTEKMLQRIFFLEDFSSLRKRLWSGGARVNTSHAVRRQ